MTNDDSVRWCEYYSQAISDGNEEVVASEIADQKLEGWKRMCKECAMEDQEDDRRRGI